MKAGEVMETLGISRSTLLRYHHKGYIHVKALPNGHFDYSDEDVWNLKFKNKKRVTVAYARVSTYKQKHDLENQINELKEFAQVRGYKLTETYHDIASDISFENRKEFFDLLELVFKGEVKQVIITHKDRLSRVGFDLLKYLFDHYHTEIIVISDEEDQKTDEQELFEEIVSLLHCFSMRMDSHRRIERKKIEKKLEENH